MKMTHPYEKFDAYRFFSFFFLCILYLSYREVSADSPCVSQASQKADPATQQPIVASHTRTENHPPEASSLDDATAPVQEKGSASFEKSDWLEAKIDIVTETLQQQLFTPSNRNLVLQALKQLPDDSSLEKISAALYQHLRKALQSVCTYDPNTLKTLGMELAKTIHQHCHLQKRKCSTFTTEDIQYLTGNFYKALQSIDLEQLVLF